jgi:hypothetical protein
LFGWQDELKLTPLHPLFISAFVQIVSIKSTMVEVDPSGIGDGSGKKCLAHSYSFVDLNQVVEERVQSLTNILLEQYGVKNERLVKALCALGEGVCAGNDVLF